MFAPELIDLEVASVYRRQLAAGHLTTDRAEAALADLAELPVRRAAHRGLLGRCWELRSNLTPYDSAYVALAEALGAVLVTADGGRPTVACSRHSLFGRGAALSRQNLR